MWDAAKGAVFGLFRGDAGGNQQMDVVESRSFEAALSSPPNPAARARNTSTLGPQPPVITVQGVVEEGRPGRVAAVARPVNGGEVMEAWERIESGQSLPEKGLKVELKPKDGSQKSTDDGKHRAHKHDDRHRGQLDAERRLAKCENEKQEISRHLQSTIERLEASESQERALMAEMQRLRHELETTKKGLHLAEERQHDMERRQQDADAQQQRTARLLDKTAAELKGANLFLTKTDALSSADVVAMLDGLNAEIMQLAAFMADTLNEKGRGQENEAPAKTHERRLNLRAVGEQLVQFLRNSQTQHLDPMAVQIPLQLCLADACYMVIQSWRPGDWRGEDILHELYSSMKTTTIQSVFGRWRAITRSQTRYQECQASVLLYFTRRLADMLSLAGWPGHDPGNLEFLGRFEERLRQVVALTLRIHKAIGEDITSAELETRCIRPNTQFNKETMDDAFPDDEKTPAGDMEDSRSTRRITAGTTDIGLWMLVDGKAKILRKPKVVRLSALAVMLGGQ